MVGPTNLRGVPTPDVGQTGEPGRERHEVVHVLRADRERLEQLPRDHLLAPDVLHVDDRRGARHRDRLLDAADGQHPVDVGGEAGGQLDAFTNDRAEAGQAEGDRVGAGRRSTTV